MREFFHGWRRKAGVVTLVMACAVMGVWTRACNINDQVSWRPSPDIEITVGFDPTAMRVDYARQTSTSAPQSPVIGATQNHSLWPAWVTARVHGDDSLLLFPSWHSGTWRSYGPFGVDARGDSFVVSIPYLFSTASLTLVSAYLILWKPRKQQPIASSLMLLAVNKHSELHVFASKEEAELQLEAIDVQQDAFDFCDARGQRYAPVYTRQPTVSNLGPLGLVDIGAFRLVAEGGLDAGLPERLVARAAHLEYTSMPTISSIEKVRDELHKRVAIEGIDCRDRL